VSPDRKLGRRPLLARLDERLVPRLGVALRGVVGTRRRAGAATGTPGRGLGRLVRREPTITAAVAIVAAAAILLYATGGDRHHAVPPARPVTPAAPALVGDVLGPTVGQPVSTYLGVAQQRLKGMATAAPSLTVTAVVDLTGYLTASALDAQLNGLAGVQVIRAFAQVAPPAAGDIHTVTLTSGSDLAADLDGLRTQAHTLVVNYRKRVALEASDPSTANEAVVTAYADEARQAKIDSAGIGAASGCVFALVVTGPASQLQRLAAQPDVRVLDPAPPSVPRDSLMIVPLEPQTIGAVPPLEFAGD
jgi:hypothetical protein